MTGDDVGEGETGAEVVGADVDGADVDGADVDVVGAEVVGAVVVGAEVVGADVVGADVVGAGDVVTLALGDGVTVGFGLLTPLPTVPVAFGAAVAGCTVRAVPPMRATSATAAAARCGVAETRGRNGGMGTPSTVTPVSSEYCGCR